MILSLSATVPLKVTVVVVEAVSFMTSAVVVVSQTEQAHPLGAVAEWPIFTVVVQFVAPAKKKPAVAPPVKDVSEQPALEVKVVPTDT